MRDLIILGTGVHAAEMAYLVERVNREAPTWTLLGHIAPGDDPPARFAGQPVLGTLERLGDFPEAAVVADNEFGKRRKVPRDRLVSLVDPSAFVHPTARIGTGSVIYSNTFVGVNAELDECVFVLSGAIINHDVRIGERTVLASGVTLAGGVVVEHDCYLGQSCTVRQYVRIGSNSLVGMGAVVLGEVEANSVVVGNPARLLRRQPPAPTDTDAPDRSAE